MGAARIDYPKIWEEGILNYLVALVGLLLTLSSGLGGERRRRCRACGGVSILEARDLRALTPTTGPAGGASRRSTTSATEGGGGPFSVVSLGGFSEGASRVMPEA